MTFSSIYSILCKKTFAKYMNYSGFNVYEKSIHRIQVGGETSEIFMAYNDTEDFLVIKGPDCGFDGEKTADGKLIAALNHMNANILRKHFAFTNPGRVLQKDRSFGLGDRLGIAAPGYIKLFECCDAFPVLVQQSIRELNLTNRSYEEVLDAASFAVFREDFQKTWGADGDHLKTFKDAEYALSLGFSMITLDCSDHIKTDIGESGTLPLLEKYKNKYLGKQFDIGEGIKLGFTEAELREIPTIYGEAISFIVEMYNRFLKDNKYNADFEISIDETISPTTPLQHYFVARELLDNGVSFATIAPRFCGEFEKGIDYIGNLSQFEKEIKIHAAIARHFNYKLSIHSGSDKFSVFPVIGKETRGVFHIKTSGTNWLEAMRVIALTEPPLYREIHKYALSVFEEAKKYYRVSANTKNIPQVDSLSDEELPSLFDRNDSRQLIHITYGFILNKKNDDGSFAFKNRLYKIWRQKKEIYAKMLERNIVNHLEQLGIGKTKNTQGEKNDKC